MGNVRPVARVPPELVARVPRELVDRVRPELVAKVPREPVAKVPLGPVANVSVRVVKAGKARVAKVVLEPVLLEPAGKVVRVPAAPEVVAKATLAKGLAGRDSDRPVPRKAVPVLEAKRSPHRPRHRNAQRAQPSGSPTTDRLGLSRWRLSGYVRSGKLRVRSTL